MADHAARLRTLLELVDARGGKVTFLPLLAGGWKAVVSGVALEPRQACAVTAADALELALAIADSARALKAG